MYTNSTGQVPAIAGFRALIDMDTPAEALTKMGQDGNEYTLVFSDEFNVDGRSFYDGDDPFFTAGRQHYYGTGDVEFYDPQSATTAGGNLVLNLSHVADPRTNYNFSYMSAMVSSWNQ
jgi:beta-glucanase (GH16 family)